LVRYIDDFVICFQYRSDAIRVQDALRLRLGKFGLTLEPTKTKLVEFGRFAQKHAGKRGRNRPETIYFLGLTLYCTRNRKGNFKVGMRTEKSRLRRSLASLQELMLQKSEQSGTGFRSKSAGDFGGNRRLISLQFGTRFRRFRHP
jgi:RNA-directed DNA polymerase